jgi:patatin-related protein
MTSLSTSTTSSAQETVEREIRFAVVIYGGVSLAVYINGVVQEMLHMVRSTAVDFDKLSRVEKVYRRLAASVGAPQPADAGDIKAAKPLGGRPGRASLRPVPLSTETTATAESEPPIFTCFKVDILSGTSAGGINAIYLAKALVNNQSLDSLARMWITDADLAQLLNDRKVRPVYLRQGSPNSLLSSAWMYLRLLTAFHAMNTPASKEDGSSTSLVDDLDLFCTTTDLRGLPVEIALTDENVEEQRYRNFYHFKRRKDSQERCNHSLTPEMDPFLAFAARCTSSFPIAFEPMELNDIVPVMANQAWLQDYVADSAHVGPNADALRLFGPDIAALKGADKFADICSIYKNNALTTMNFADRPFGDGGYLDNKPFTYAIQTMKRRHATLPVDRKLIYIEPAPEKFSDPQTSVKGKKERPNAIENSLDALVELPRYETIRQDIENVVQWNADIARLRRVIDDINEKLDEKEDAEGAQAGGDPSTHPAYWRLRLSGAADQLSARMAEAINLDPSSAPGQALRSIAGAWRVKYFGESIHAERRFLDLFDFDFCERAIRFLRQRLQQLPDAPADARLRKHEVLTNLAGITEHFLTLSGERLPLDLAQWSEAPLATECWSQYLTFIVDPKAAAQLLSASELRESWPFPGEPSSRDLAEFFSTTYRGRDLRVGWLFDCKHNSRILALGTTPDGPPPVPVCFGSIVNHIAEQLIRHYSCGRLNYDPSLTLPLDSSQSSCLQDFVGRLGPLFKLSGDTGRSGWDRFVRQDFQVYPIVFGTSLGEFETVDIFRISPQETRAIADTAPSGAGSSNPPLRGASLGDFGAFLDRRWRLSDMLRGRLDGAERLITAVLPDSDAATLEVREDLIRQAQDAIALEWEDFQKQFSVDVSAPSSASPALPTEFEGRGATIAEKGQPRKLGSRPTAIIRSVYRFGAVDADPHDILRELSRSTIIVGKMLDGLASEYNVAGKKLTGTIVGAGRVLWGLVEVSVPDSILRYLFRNWLWIFALIGTVNVGIGFSIGAPAVWKIGILLVSLVFLANFLSGLFRSYMSTGTFPRRVLKSATLMIFASVLIGATCICIYDRSEIANAVWRVVVFFRFAAHLVRSPLAALHNNSR